MVHQPSPVYFKQRVFWLHFDKKNSANKVPQMTAAE